MDGMYFTLFFFVFMLCFVVPPKEFVAAGLTVQNIFYSYLGSESVDFVGYHMKRTSLTLLIHSLIPIVYYVSLGLVAPHLKLIHVTLLTPLNALFFLLCISSAICGILIFLAWNAANHRYHPLAKDLEKFSTPWRSVAAVINTEFRRLEKFSSVRGGIRIYVTDSWIMKCATYRVHVAQQTDSHLSVLTAENFDYGGEFNGQLLRIKVISIAPHEHSFEVALNSYEYNDMKNRLNAPVVNARNVIIHQTLNDRFIVSFREQVQRNGPPQVSVNTDVEECIGCLQKPANIKLTRCCTDIEGSTCGECFCRPMWCLECMGSWYASRQDQHNVSGWMSSNAPCPTCRTTFCMLDVTHIQ